MSNEDSENPDKNRSDILTNQLTDNYTYLSSLVREKFYGKSI
jgi:hypothetical protein